MRTIPVLVTLYLAIASSLSPASTKATAPASAPKVRTYFIAADEVEWDYSPNAVKLLISGENELDHAPFINLKTYLKAVYHEYTDETFETLKPRTEDWDHLGILGPLIRAEVGDTVKVVFRNNTRIFCSMHPHGLAYDKANEGALYYLDGRTLDEKKSGRVQPHQTFTYTWTVPESAGPGPGDPSSILWMYHSHYIESRDVNSGLFGPIIVTRKGFAKPDGSPKDVDREFVVSFDVFDEGQSAYFLENIVHRAQAKVSTLKDPALHKSLEFFTMNGLSQGTLPMLTMKKGERVRWYLFSTSNEDDVHTPHWHGQTVISNMMRTDTVSLGPMTMVVADMIPSSIGTWLFHCHVNDHLNGGMLARFTVLP